MSTYSTTGGHLYREQYQASCTCIESMVDSDIFQSEQIQNWAIPDGPAESNQTMIPVAVRASDLQ